MPATLQSLEDLTEFQARHIGISADDEHHMLNVIGAATRSRLIESIIPRAITRGAPMELPAPLTEAAALAELRTLAARNRLVKSCIGQGYHGTHTPAVVAGWFTTIPEALLAMVHGDRIVEPRPSVVAIYAGQRSTGEHVRPVKMQS